LVAITICKPACPARADDGQSGRFCSARAVQIQARREECPFTAQTHSSAYIPVNHQPIARKILCDVVDVTRPKNRVKASAVFLIIPLTFEVLEKTEEKIATESAHEGALLLYVKCTSIFPRFLGRFSFSNTRHGTCRN